MENNKTIIPIDLDETILRCEFVQCHSCKKWDYVNPKPIQKEIDRVNTLFDRGFQIIIYTARPWELIFDTKNQLEKLGIRYTAIVMGKVPGKPVDADALRSLEEFDR